MKKIIILTFNAKHFLDENVIGENEFWVFP